jgi:hypothetical protein
MYLKVWKMELFDEIELKLFIEKKFKVSSFRVPFYVNWIRMYNNYAANSNSTDNIQDKFINSLNNKYPEWQVEQADKAVAIYFSFVRNSNKCSTTNRTKDNFIWKNTIFKMKEEIRLQNKSQQTEHSYIYWLKSSIEEVLGYLNASISV